MALGFLYAMRLERGGEANGLRVGSFLGLSA
jgi:hypothetical protein